MTKIRCRSMSANAQIQVTGTTAQLTCGHAELLVRTASIAASAMSDGWILRFSLPLPISAVIWVATMPGFMSTTFMLCSRKFW